LGNGGRDAVVNPVQATGLTGIIAVAAGNAHALALGGDGRVWAWGANASGQLGDGSFKASLVPVVTGLAEIVRIRAGGDHSAAVSRRRTLYLWGENADGQLGLGAGAPADLGVPAGAAQAVVDAAPGSRMTLLVGSDGLARSAGANDAGSLGDGGTTARNTFGAVSAVSAGITVGAGGLSFAAAIADNGTTFMWGDNGSKQLGNTTITATGTATPTAVPNFDAIP
jgi:alpha-tubulin suppressor-like RCC1 family protein